jgi:predicted cupin superfamily sugar epimerase
MARAAGQGQRWIAELGLEPLAGESGWWRHAGASAVTVRVGDIASPAFSAIYYLLDAERPVNVWHRLDSDDTHVLIDGGPVEYVLLHDELAPTRLVLGRDLAAGQMPMLTAPGGSWKALRLLDPEGFALMATIVTPAWRPDGVRIGLPAHEAERWAGAVPWLSASLIERLGRP